MPYILIAIRLVNSGRMPIRLRCGWAFVVNRPVGGESRKPRHLHVVYESVGLLGELVSDSVGSDGAGPGNRLSEVRVDRRRAGAVHSPQLVRRHHVESLGAKNRHFLHNSNKI